MIFCEDDLMIGWQLFKIAAGDLGIYLVCFFNIIIVPESLAKTYKNLCKDRCVVGRTVMIELSEL